MEREIFNTLGDKNLLGTPPFAHCTVPEKAFDEAAYAHVVERLECVAKEALYPFYQRFVQAVTGVRDGLPTCNSSDGANGFAIPDDGVTTCAAPDLGVHDDHAYLFEPCVLRNSVDVSLQHITEPWTTYDQLIFAPHTYTGQVSR